MPDLLDVIDILSHIYMTSTVLACCRTYLMCLTVMSLFVQVKFLCMSACATYVSLQSNQLLLHLLFKCFFIYKLN